MNKINSQQTLKNNNIIKIKSKNSNKYEPFQTYDNKKKK